MIEINPGFWLAHLYKGRAYDAKGAFNEAIEELQQARKLNDHPWVLANLVHAYAGAGQRGEALKALEDLKDRQQKQRFVNSFSFVLAYTGLGGKERAFEWLQKTIDDHSEDATTFKSDPQLDPLRPDPRFAELVRRVGL